MGRLQTLRTHPSYAALAILTLTISVGANLLVFTIVNALWLRPLPVADPDRIVLVSNVSVFGGADNPVDLIPAARLEDFRRATVFEGVAGQVTSTVLGEDVRPRIAIDRVGHPVETLGVTSEYFSVLGVDVKGRGFTVSDDRPSAPAVAVISDRLWRSAFDAAPTVIGTRVATSHMPLEIVGIAPAGFRGARLGEQINLWIPRYLVPQFSTIANAGNMQAASMQDLDHLLPLLVVARLRTGVTAADAERAIAQPESRLIVRPLRDVFAAQNRPTILMREPVVLRILTVTASFVLLAGCTSLMAIVLVHYERRRQELAVRLALGATPGRLFRRLVAELLLIGIAGLTGAVVVTACAIRVLPALTLPGGVDLSRLDLSIDWRVAGIGVAAAGLALAAAAVVPLRRFLQANLMTRLVSSATTGAPPSLRLRRAVLGLHVAVTLIVLVGAGLFARTLAYGFGRGPGFDVERTAFLYLQPSFFGFIDSSGSENKEAREVAALTRLIDGLRALPGIEGVAVGTPPILDPVPPIGSTKIAADGFTSEMAIVTSRQPPGYLEALGVRPAAGRTLTDVDVGATSTVPAVITSTLAKRLWPNATPIGRQFSVTAPTAETFQVVGVVPDVVCQSLQSAPCGTIFRPAVADPRRQVAFGIKLTLRARTDAAQLTEPVRRLASETFPNAAHLDVSTGRDLVVRDLGQQRLGLFFFSGFGVLALALGISGVFGLVAYLVESRRREHGVRLALGATPWSLVRRGAFAGLWPVAVGTLIGLGGAALLAGTVDALFVGVSRLDPMAYVGAASVMIGAATLSGFAAAWKIRRLAPMDVLRTE